MVYTISNKSIDKKGYIRPRFLSKVDLDYTRELPKPIEKKVSMPDYIVQATDGEAIVVDPVVELPTVDEILLEAKKGWLSKTFGKKK
jgi:hypothetical protein